MKTILSILLLVSASAMAAVPMLPTAPMRLAWDGNAPAYEVWRGIERLATVSEPSSVLRLPASVLSTLVVVAIYPTGERMPSDPFTVQPVQAQDSDDLIDWESRTFFVPHGPRRFFRFYLPLFDQALSN